jgi:hypothetical protein
MTNVNENIINSLKKKEQNKQEEKGWNGYFIGLKH